MTISIHHGANGSYKTSGVVQDYLIPAIKEGRTVVTNIRGVNTDNCFDVIEDAHQDFKVIFIDTDSTEGRKRILTFWHWVPLGSLLLFDEAGVMFPKRLKDSDLNKLSLQNAEDLGRPRDWIEAWEMHRHYNWDIVLSAPNIKSVRMDIRDTSEGAYIHRNNAFIGLKGSYNEGFHKASDNGTNSSHFIYVKKKKINEQTFKLYKSTKTGKVKDSMAKSSLFDNGRLLISLVVLVAAVGFIFNSFFGFSDPEKNNHSFLLSDKKNDELVISKNNNSGSSYANRNDVVIKSHESNLVEPFAGFDVSIVGTISDSDKELYLLRFEKEGSYLIQNSDQIFDAGYLVKRVSDCVALLIFTTHTKTILCKGHKIKRLSDESPSRESV